jgi:hypothetical protein
MKQHIVFVLDKSGSMETIRDRVISGFNEFLEDQKREAKRRGDDVRLTLTLFDSPVYNNVLGQVGFVNAYVNEKIADVPGLTKETYVPGGATALLDAIERTLDQVGDCDGAERVVMVVMTDGEENSSEEATKDGIKGRIDERVAAGWAVVYLGANVDEFAEAAAIGVADYRARGWDATADGTDLVMADLSRATTRNLAPRGAPSERFWDEDEGSHT